MTPFGNKLRALRAERQVNQKEMAAALNVSPAYLSALEHGKRGKPQWSMVQRIITYFNIIWDEAEELQYLASVSDPNVSINTVELSSQATRLANLLSQDIAVLKETEIENLILLLEKRLDPSLTP